MDTRSSRGQRRRFPPRSNGPLEVREPLPRKRGVPVRTGAALMWPALGLAMKTTLALAQPDYPPAHWVPPVGCNKWYTSGNGHHFCVIHDMEGYYESSISYLNNCSVSASVYYLVNGLQNGSDNLGHHENNPNDAPAGDITQSVREQYYAWHVRCWNTWMFGTEHEGFVSTPAWYSEAMYQASAGLQRHLCDTYGIPKDRNHIIGHNEWQNAAWRTWMTNNFPAINPTCNTHTDPGQYWNWSHFMSLIIDTAPVISIQPQSQAVNPGQNATFSVTASGAQPLAYQWSWNGGTLAGATNSAYTRTNVQPADAGAYSVVVSNQFGSVTSSNGVLTVNTAPFITAQPQSQTVFPGQPVTIPVGAGGTSPLNYQWRFNGNLIAGATASAYSIASARLTNSGTYFVSITNAFGYAVSSNAFLAIVPLAGWGDNSASQITSPPQATNLVAISAGAWHSLALRADGVIAAWGADWNGQADVPAGLKDAVAIATGGYHSLALRQNGTVAAWGANDYGQSAIPPGLEGVIAIAAGAWHSLALKADGSVVAWGNNSLGQTNVPPELAGVATLAAGGSHSLALKADGTLVAWGDNTDAGGSFVGQSVVPDGLASVVAIAAGEYHSLVVKNDGTVVAWGDNSQSQSSPPEGLTGVVAVAAGRAHSLALKADGSVVAWGANLSGQCNLPAALANAVAVSAGAYHSLALVDDGTFVPRLFSPVAIGGRFSVLLQTLNRKHYALEYKISPAASNWTTISNVAGNGVLKLLTDPAASVSPRFYRVRQWQ